MARAALKWSVNDLGEKANVRAATVSSFERGGDAYRSTVEALRAALEGGGVTFLGNGEASLSGGPGVRVAHPKIRHGEV